MGELKEKEKMGSSGKDIIVQLGMTRKVQILTKGAELTVLFCTPGSFTEDCAWSAI